MAKRQTKKLKKEVNVDSSGNLRIVTDEELMTNMQDLVNPVECRADIPREKERLFRAVHKAGNRSTRKKLARKLNVDWGQYQIYKELKY